MKRKTIVRPSSKRQSVKASANSMDYAAIKRFERDLKQSLDTFENMNVQTQNEVSEVVGDSFYEHLLDAVRDLAEYNR